MNRLLITSLLAGLVLAAACAPSPTPVRIEKFVPVDDPTLCAPSDFDNAAASGGSLDVTPGSPAFVIAMRLRGGDQFTTPPVTITGGRTLEPQDRNQPVIDRLVFTYTARPNSLGLKLDQAQVSRSVPFLDDGTASIENVNIISTQVADELVAKVAPGDDVELQVAVEARGRMSGDGASITSGPLVFPIRVYASDPATCAGAIRQPTAADCTYPGQSTRGPASVCCADLLPGTSGCP